MTSSTRKLHYHTQQARLARPRVTLGKMLAKAAAVTAGLFACAVLAQVPGPVILQGIGGNTINQVTTPVYGSGGTVSTLGSYRVHVFNSSGTFVPPAGLTSVDVLVVGGGGGGGGTYGGGGGGGGVRWVTGVTVSGSTSVTVGGGGSGGAGVTSTNDTSGNATNGGNSTFASPSPIVATGGGYGQGGAQNTPDNLTGGTGGSGGGGGGITSGSQNIGGAGTVSQGNAGGSGNGDTTSNRRSGGGGGGAGGAGTVGLDNSGGNGGIGINHSANVGAVGGAAGWFGGGGGGGKRSGTGTASSGGQGGGGAGAAGGGGGTTTVGTAGIANTGGGGGASSNGEAGAAGGSGIVVVRYIPPTVTYVVHRYTSSGTFTPPPGVSSVEVLVVGGGGGGGTSKTFSTAGAGGGGAGGLVSRTSFAIAGPVSVGVGSGGAGATSGNTSGVNGVNSTFGSLVALGGGGGAGGNVQGNAGGSGGGSRGNDGGVANQPGSASGGAGFRGGNMPGSPGGAGASGGGGAGAAGQDIAGISGEGGGNGGVGLSNSITGSALFYAGGGGGGASQNSGAVGAGGTGGGGAGGRNDTPATAGTTNTGGGGGGGNNDVSGANGGSGVVFVRYTAPTLRIVQQPSTTADSGAAFAQNTIVELRNSAGVAISGENITASIGSGAGTLGGTLTRTTDVNGQAIFNDLQITGAAGDRRIRFASAKSANFVESNTVTISVPITHFEITHVASVGVCASTTSVTIRAIDSNSNPVTNYVGTMTITNGLNLGTYTLNTGTPANFSDVTSNDGAAQYTFAPADLGVVTLNFTAPSIGTYAFNATATSVVTENYAGGLIVSACSFRVSHDTAANVCSVEQITIGVYANGVVVPGYTGTVNLSTNGVTGGNWTKTLTASDALGTLDNGASNDGAGSYIFVSGDNGQITLNFQSNAAETINFNVTAPGVSAPTGLNDQDLVISACTFRITHSESMDVCSIELVTVTIVNSSGATVTGYTGTVNLSTTTGRGSWNKTLTASDAEGTLTDPVTGDGGATYSFVGADAGTITVRFTHPGASGTVNINVSDGSTLDPRDNASAYDKNIAVGLCKFEISHSESSTACEIEAVTIRVRDSLGGLALDYEGTMTLATSTNHGNWLVNTGAGVLTDTVGDDNGVATYKFGASDNGQVILDFSNPHAEVVNFDALDNAIIVDATLDPNLVVTSCLPALVGTAQCTVGNSDTLAIPARSPVANQQGRMVLMFVFGANTTAVSSANFNSTAMTLIRRQTDPNDGGNATELWGILDSNLPAGSGTYTGGFTGGPLGAAMCLLAVNEVEQVFPSASSPAASGPLNSSAGSGWVKETTITTQDNNSLIVAGTSFDTENYWNFAAPSPNYLTRIFGDAAPKVANPDNGSGPAEDEARFAGSAGRLPTAGIADIREELEFGAFANPPAGTQIVVSFKPLVAGAPLASGYVPVLLEQTYAGNLSYRAIGATLRSTYNESSPTPLGCNFVNFATGTSATLTMPVGSTVRAAYLYWAGSGSAELGQEDGDVSFGPTGSEVPITADDIYEIDNTGLNGTVDYFAGYKDVTAVVTTSGSYTLKDLTVQSGAPWSDTQSCAGIWGLVAIYEHVNERLRVVNLFQGFQPFQNSAFTLVPRNFRMATNDAVLDLPNGQVTHITVEGDETLNSPDNKEGLGIQTAPNATTFTNIISSLNPLGQEFNSTVTRPVYVYDAGAGYYVFDETAGTNGDGFEIDVPGPQVNSGGPRFGNSWGLDVDTHYIDGGAPGTLLYNFAIDGQEAEQITTRYSAEQDLVMLISEVISVTNFPVADLELTKTETSTFKVNGEGSYQFVVNNNGNGGVSGGYAEGEVLVADILPAGFTFASAGAVSGTGWSCSVTTDPGAFSCTYDIDSTWTGGAVTGRLSAGESLPPINATVTIGDSTFFPLRNNNAKNTARMLYSGGNCPATANGIIPDPDDCDRSPQFDNINDLEGGNIDINDLDDKQVNNNNLDGITSVVKGVEVDLEMEKFVEDILEAGSSGVYTLRITNNGPDATTATITVNDVEPTGVTFQSAAGTGWICPSPPGNLVCTFAGSLGVGQSTDILVTVDVTGADGYLVTNTASVSAGAFNFDVDDTNNSDTDITEIEGPPVASQEKFLLSVSSLGEQTSIGGLTDFEDDDYIIYDPATDTAEMFFDNSALGFNVNDADAVHLLKNGHIVISAKTASSIGTGPGLINFGPGDLVVYDPILGTASLLFDGDTIFGGPNPGANNITAVYVNNDGSIDIAVQASDPGSTIGSNNVPLNNQSIFRYYTSGPSAGTATNVLDVGGYLEGGSDSGAIITGFYPRVDPSNTNATLETYVLSFQDPNDGLVTTGIGFDPSTGTVVTQDDVTQIDETGSTTTSNLFLGDVELGVFESTGSLSNLLIDALHLIEDPYVGHFRISEYGGSTSVCSPTGLQLRISKHEGLSHSRDTDYYGSVRLTTDTNLGDWTLVSGSGTLSNGTADDGAAIYTFVPADGGTVILSLKQSDAGTVNIDVSNGVAREGIPAGTGSEAPLFTYSEGVTLNYLDSFSTISYANQNGTNAWSTNWVENDNGTPSGATAGDVRVTGGKAVFRRTAGTTQPSLMRSIDLSGATLNSDLILSFSYSYANLNSFEEFVVEARHDSAASWQQVALYKRGTSLPNVATGNALSGNLNLSAVFAGTPGASTQIRFRVVQGYTTGATFSIDDVKLTAETSNCNVSPLGVNHYEISINGVYNNNTYNGVACVGAEVTITGHDGAHSPVTPGNIAVYLTSSSNKGNWSRVISGGGSLVNGSVNNGAASYTFPANENSVTLLFDYTGPATDPEVVNINVTDNIITELSSEDPNYSVSQIGLRVLDTSTGSTATPIPLQIAGKPSNVNPIASVLYVQVVNSSGSNPGVCEPLFSVGETLDLEFAAQCDDPTQCVTATESFEVNGTSVALIDQGDTVNYTTVPIMLTDVGGGSPGAPININYSDVGKMRLLSRFDIPYGDNLDPQLATKSGSQISVSSNQFVVRPFAFDIDFTDGRANNGSGDASYATDHTGSPWRIAGEAFDTTVSAVAWESGDDTNNDGVPDTGADLSDNHVTPNFDQDSAAGGYSVKLSIVENKVPGGIDGILSNDNFDGFVSGVNTHTITYNEVGIIDLRADIVDGSDSVIPYLGTANVPGQVLNVGRFYPNLFAVTQKTLTGRSDLVCTPDSGFTYMNEPFQVEFELTAKGLTDSGNYTTVNYRGNYAKLDSFGELSLVAINDVAGASDVDYSTRLANSSLPTSFAGTWSSGVLTLSGDMIFQRNAAATPDGPFPAMQIAFKPTDNDGVTIDPARIDVLTSLGVLDVDLDIFPTEPGTAAYYLIDEHEFRYGRLIVNNAYGPETEDLALTFLVEYYNGSEFVRNMLDNCSVLDIADVSFVTGTYTGDLDSGETALISPDTVTFLNGQTQGYENVALPSDSPLETSAPGEDVLGNPNTGTVNITVDLSAAGLSYLSFEWDDADDDYDEDPTGQIEFGQYRMHDRIINWQEIYNSPSP